MWNTNSDLTAAAAAAPAPAPAPLFIYLFIYFPRRLPLPPDDTNCRSLQQMALVRGGQVTDDLPTPPAPPRAPEPCPAPPSPPPPCLAANLSAPFPSPPGLLFFFFVFAPLYPPLQHFPTPLLFHPSSFGPYLMGKHAPPQWCRPSGRSRW